MNNDIEGELSKENLAIKPIQEKSRLGQKITSFLVRPLRRKQRPSQEYHESENEIEATKIVEGKLSLQERIDKALAAQNIFSPDFKSEGASSFFGTNEKLNPEVFQNVSSTSDRPNGYIIGAGVSGILTAFEAFAGDSPEGLVLINVDPKAVQNARDFVDTLTAGRVLLQDGGGSRSVFTPGKDILSSIDPYYDGSQIIDTNKVACLHALKLIKLAQEGRILVFQQNIFNKNFLEVLAEQLPDVKQRRNVVYLSNIGDWIRREGVWEEGGIIAQFNEYKKLYPEAEKLPQEQVLSFWETRYSPFRNLGILTPDSPNFNYYIDTSEKRGYLQRVAKSPPNEKNYLNLVTQD